jgi:anti-sigma factor RsiW
MTAVPTSECERILSGISAYLDGEAAQSECEDIERHCRTCESCATVVNGLRETVGLCRSAGDLPLPEAVRARARASVRALLGKEQK